MPGNMSSMPTLAQMWPDNGGGPSCRSVTATLGTCCEGQLAGEVRFHQVARRQLVEASLPVVSQENGVGRRADKVLNALAP